MLCERGWYVMIVPVAVCVVELVVLRVLGVCSVGVLFSVCGVAVVVDAMRRGEWPSGLSLSPPRHSRRYGMICSRARGKL